ncbi:FHA domain-containing protein [Dactylosporangium darangshiense]|uniref:FHA domain-containing protein n=1 Tax=Dactylosporangium darangshiense TaxID=579108 RepID=A0ABP8D6T4_9ACTN
MRFEISRVMDTIEQRLTTDVTLAQAVVDLAEVARFVALDGGRPINLLRLGMVVDALSRYLIDAGAMLYPVTGREVLSEAALTSKERMVLGRWADDGLIEVTPVVADRPAEIADFTGLPLIVVRDTPQYAARFPWLADSPERVLRLSPRAGGAVLTPGGEPAPPKDGKERLVVVGKATLPIVPPDPEDPATEKPMATPSPIEDQRADTPGPEEASSDNSDAPAAATATLAGPDADKSDPDKSDVGESDVDKPAAASDMASASASASASDSDSGDPTSGSAASGSAASGSAASDSSDSDTSVSAGIAGSDKSPSSDKSDNSSPKPSPSPEVKGGRPDGLQTFTARGAQRSGRTRVVRRRFTRADPSGVGAALMARQWRCKEPDCPAFGEYRRIGQPVPRMRGGVPACPRHGEAVKDIGPRPAAFAVAIVVDDLARRRFVVAANHPVIVGRDPSDPDEISVGAWLHEAAAAWIAKEHLRLEVTDARLRVTDTSNNGTLIWKRSTPDVKEETQRIYHKSYNLDGWDSIELYTGVELVVGDHRLQTVVGSEPASVLLDAPTVALRLVN